MAYQGYSGYDTDSVKRKRAMADALMERSMQGGQPIQHWTQGLSQIGEALLANYANKRATKAETEYGAARKQIADKLMSSAFPGSGEVMGAQLASDQPVNLTPEGYTERDQQGGLGDQVKLMASLTGDPMMAMQYGQGQKRQLRDDALAADKLQYDRGRDTVGDQRWETTFGYQQGRDQVGDQQFDRTFDRSGRQFDAKMGQDQNQFDATMGFNREQLGVTKAAKDAELGIKQAELAAKQGNGGFEPAQLATIYNKNMDALDDARNKQSGFDTIATASQQFLDKTKDGSLGLGFWAQGEGPINDLAQGLSMDTTTLKSLTSRIAPLMREAGSGASSDRDIEMFKSAVVSINNTPEANKRFAKGARLMADRNRQFTTFLNAAINPNDPQSRQKAQAMWDQYKEEVPVFDAKSGMPLESVMPFREWAKSGRTPQMQVDDVSDLLEKYR